MGNLQNSPPAVQGSQIPVAELNQHSVATRLVPIREAYILDLDIPEFLAQHYTLALAERVPREVFEAQLNQWKSKFITAQTQHVELWMRTHRAWRALAFLRTSAVIDTTPCKVSHFLVLVVTALMVVCASRNVRRVVSTAVVLAVGGVLLFFTCLNAFTEMKLRRESRAQAVVAARDEFKQIQRTFAPRGVYVERTVHAQEGSGKFRVWAFHVSHSKEGFVQEWACGGGCQGGVNGVPDSPTSGVQMRSLELDTINLLA